MHYDEDKPTRPCTKQAGKLLTPAQRIGEEIIRCMVECRMADRRDHDKPYTSDFVDGLKHAFFLVTGNEFPL